LSLFSDIAFAFSRRCPVCREGRLFQPWSLAAMERCGCGAELGKHDVGDGAAVFLIFLLGFTLIPLAWAIQVAFSPPLWVPVAFVAVSALALIALILPAVRAYIILLEYRHRQKKQ
jgi:uncharacterized protein (DUF983 family)